MKNTSEVKGTIIDIVDNGSTIELAMQEKPHSRWKFWLFWKKYKPIAVMFDHRMFDGFIGYALGDEDGCYDEDDTDWRDLIGIECIYDRTTETVFVPSAFAYNEGVI